MEQERRDHELALRLATETGSGVEDMPVLKRSSLVTAHRYSPTIIHFSLFAIDCRGCYAHQIIFLNKCYEEKYFFSLQ